MLIETRGATRRLTAWVALALIAVCATMDGQSQVGDGVAHEGHAWLQWGGPSRNFVSASTGRAPTWPAGGPKKLWSRPLGEGHSSILAENGRLYTLYRQAERSPGARPPEEVVAA